MLSTMMLCCAQSFSCVRLFVTPWTVAHQAPCPWNFPGKNTGAGCHFLLQGIFSTQGSNLCLLHWQVDSLPRYHLGSPFKNDTRLAWKIPWMEEPGRLQSMGSLRVGHNWATSLSLFSFMHLRRKWQPTPVFLTGESPRTGSHRVGHDWSD